MGETDETRAAPPGAAIEEGEAAVIEAAAHSDPVARGVESDQGQQDEIEMTRVDAASTRPRLGDAESVRRQSIARAVGGEGQTRGSPRAEDRQVRLPAGLGATS